MEQRVRKKRKLGSYPFASVTFSTALALFVVGLFGLVLIHANNLTRLIQENIEVEVFLNKAITSSEVSKIERAIGSKSYVLQQEGKPRITFISKEQAAKEFMSQTGEDFTKFLGENPLRDHFVINLRTGYHRSDSLKVVKKDIEAIRGVFEVAYVESLVDSIHSNLAKIGAILIGFSIILFLIVVILINNTIKLALFSQRFLIRSMQLVGATGRFIRNPFLIRAAIYGAVAGLVSSAGLWLALSFANKRIEDLSQLGNRDSMLLLFLSLMAMGMIVGVVSTYLAIRKYLKMSLDELY